MESGSGQGNVGLHITVLFLLSSGSFTLNKKGDANVFSVTLASFLKWRVR